METKTVIFEGKKIEFFSSIDPSEIEDNSDLFDLEDTLILNMEELNTDDE